MIYFSKYKIEISAMDAMALADFLDLIGNHYDLGDELLCCFGRFIHAVSDAGCKALPKDFLFSSEVLDSIGSNGTGKCIK